KNEGLRAKNRARARRFAFAAPPPPWRFNENVLETARDDDRPQEVSEILGVGDGRRGRRAGDTAQPNVARWGANGSRLVQVIISGQLSQCSYNLAFSCS